MAPEPSLDALSTARTLIGRYCCARRPLRTSGSHAAPSVATSNTNIDGSSGSSMSRASLPRRLVHLPLTRVFGAVWAWRARLSKELRPCQAGKASDVRGELLLLRPAAPASGLLGGLLRRLPLSRLALRCSLLPCRLLCGC